MWMCVGGLCLGGLLFAMCAGWATDTAMPLIAVLLVVPAALMLWLTSENARPQGGPPLLTNHFSGDWTGVHSKPVQPSLPRLHPPVTTPALTRYTDPTPRSCL
jgi:hypothetical protein